MLLSWRLWIILMAALLATEVKASDYGPDDVIGGFQTGGYVDTRIDGNTAIVHYDGTRYDSPALVHQYLLYRCAQITISNGYDYFIIVSTNTSRYNVHVHTRETTHYVSSQPKLYDQYYTTTDYESASYVKSKAPHDASRCAPQYPHGASAVIKMFNGDVPQDVPRAYDAQDIIGHLGPATF
jgi:hypothetical protein